MNGSGIHLAEQKRIPTRPTQCVPVRPAQPTIPNPNKGCRMPSVQLLRMRPSSSSWNGTISQFVGRVIRLMPCLSHYQGLETLSPSMLLTARLVICQLRLPTLALLSAPAVLCLWETIQPPNARAPSQPFLFRSCQSTTKHPYLASRLPYRFRRVSPDLHSKASLRPGALVSRWWLPRTISKSPFPTDLQIWSAFLITSAFQGFSQKPPK